MQARLLGAPSTGPQIAQQFAGVAKLGQRRRTQTALFACLAHMRGNSLDCAKSAGGKRKRKNRFGNPVV